MEKEREIPYDSTKDTRAHIRRVHDLLHEDIFELGQRANRHDLSKLASPEKEAFDRETPLLKSLTYGSDEYKEALGRLQEALTHHYQMNSHHPEYYDDGVDGMTLLDVVEMLNDWKAASERHENGDIWKSIDINAERFKLSPQIVSILRNTAKSKGW